MDEMKIKSKIFTGVLSKIISKSVKNFIGTDCKISIEEIQLKNDGNNTSIKIDIEGCVSTSKIPEIIDKIMKS